MGLYNTVLRYRVCKITTSSSRSMAMCLCRRLEQRSKAWQGPKLLRRPASRTLPFQDPLSQLRADYNNPLSTERSKTTTNIKGTANR